MQASQNKCELNKKNVNLTKYVHANITEYTYMQT